MGSARVYRPQFVEESPPLLVAAAGQVFAVDGDDILAGLDEIATHLGLSVNHVQRQIGKSIPARRIGTKWVTSRAALAHYIATSLEDR